MHAILVDVTHYGLKVIAKYQSSTKDLPGHKIQKKMNNFPSIAPFGKTVFNLWNCLAVATLWIWKVNF